jgi:hypothetical protein
VGDYSIIAKFDKKYMRFLLRSKGIMSKMATFRLHLCPLGLNLQCRAEMITASRAGGTASALSMRTGRCVGRRGQVND